MEYNSTLENVIPPRLLRKLRRIPRLAELEKMFDEPTSSEDILPASHQNPTANDAIPGPSSNCLQSALGNLHGVSSIPRPLQTNGDIDCEIVETTNSSNLIDLTVDEDIEYMVNKQDKSTNTLILLDSNRNSVESNIEYNDFLSMIRKPVSSTASLREASRDHVIMIQLPTSRNSGSEPQVESENLASIGTQTDVVPRQYITHEDSFYCDVRHLEFARHVWNNFLDSPLTSLDEWDTTAAVKTNDEIFNEIINKSTTKNQGNKNSQNANKNECRKSTTKRLLRDCPICLDKLRCADLASTLCGHVFCMQCIKAVVQFGNKKCPTCRKSLSKKSYHAIYL